jgi:hypothetical protein
VSVPPRVDSLRGSETFEILKPVQHQFHFAPARPGALPENRQEPIPIGADVPVLVPERPLGKVQSESGVVHVVVDELWRPALTLEPTKVSSRDFH